jgi:large subunit ribosomal protein L47
MLARALKKLAPSRCLATLNANNGFQKHSFCLLMNSPNASVVPSASASASSAGVLLSVASTWNDSRHHHLCINQQRRFISLSSPLQQQSSSNNGDDTDTTIGTTQNNDTDDDAYSNKKAMIDRWMRWNTLSTFRYTPNPTLISQISPNGLTSSSPLNAFRDLVPKAKRESEPVGRSWSVKELRRKSYDDLHKLWYILYKERNMLLTETNLARRHGYEMVQPDRKSKVQKSMGAIKHVLGERKRKKIGEYREYLKEVERINEMMKKTANITTTTTVMTSDDSNIEDGMEADAQNLSLNEKA